MESYPDYTAENREYLQSLSLHSMSIAELVESDRRVGWKLHCSDGVWWREVKPLFYFPATYTTLLVPHQASPHPWLAVGGYYHMVPSGVPGNGVIIANEISDPAGYDLSKLPKKRTQVQRALEHFRIRRVTELRDLLNDGYDIYLDWERRTSEVRVKRSDRTVFERWITSVFHHPYYLVLGAYNEQSLVAYIIAYAADGVADVSKSFAHSAWKQLSPTSALIYSYVRICARNPEIRKAWLGLRSMSESLQRFKSVLGFREVAYPAYIHIRPLVRPLVRHFFPREYQRLMGQYGQASTAQQKIA